MGIGITQIQDPATRTAIKALLDQFQALQARVATLEAAAVRYGTQTIDAHGLRVSNVAAPQASTDVVTRGFLEQYVQAQAKVL